MPNTTPDDYFEHFRANVWPNLAASVCSISVADNLPDGKVTLDLIRAATEIGCGLLLDKPLLVLVPRGVTPTPGLLRAADVVLYDVDIGDPATQERIVAALRELGVVAE